MRAANYPSFTDAQVSSIIAASRAVPDNLRSRFLEAIVDRVMPADQPADEIVEEAFRHVAIRFGINVNAGKRAMTWPMTTAVMRSVSPRS